MPKALNPVLVADSSRFGTACVDGGSGSECVEVEAIDRLTPCGAGYVLEVPSMHAKVRDLDSDCL